MSDVILGMVGVGLAMFFFILGVVMATLSNKKKTKNWIEENGCYICKEKWETGRLDLDDE